MPSPMPIRASSHRPVSPKSGPQAPKALRDVASHSTPIAATALRPRTPRVRTGPCRRPSRCHPTRPPAASAPTRPAPTYASTPHHTSPSPISTTATVRRPVRWTPPPVVAGRSRRPAGDPSGTTRRRWPDTSRSCRRVIRPVAPRDVRTPPSRQRRDVRRIGNSRDVLAHWPDLTDCRVDVAGAARDQPTPRWKRIVFKPSGEALAGESGRGLDGPTLDQTAAEIVEIRQHLGVDVAVVVGGGNFWRGRTGAMEGMDATQSDHIGMLGTVMNALALQDALERRGQPTGCSRRSRCRASPSRTSAGGRCVTWRRAGS